MLIILTGPHKVKKFHVLWDSMRALDWECSSSRSRALLKEQQTVGFPTLHS